eukprot:gnl/MRDRNA2_/MRDRNA2_108475_c0_seq1.p1 gnl/MRDRNA2_/MRDRNA2_108475_c0~~gnl/MRDRNA2_/MRDRNA2_108475_c0_seq1.p1  ORF type:complete len:989 (+),score=161.32 gnl/MRDRNA2_/MRDRNA2_108475_c0_seq1:56-3022(+)
MAPSLASGLVACTQAETLAAAAAIHLEQARHRCDRTPDAPGVQKAVRAAAEAFVAASGEAAAAALQRGDPQAAEKWLTDALVHLDGVGSGASANLERDCAEALLRLRSLTKPVTHEDPVRGLRQSRSAGALRPRSACITQHGSVGTSGTSGSLGTSASSGSLGSKKDSIFCQRPCSAGPSVARGDAKGTGQLDVWPRNPRVPKSAAHHNGLNGLQTSQSTSKKGFVIPPRPRRPPEIPPLPSSLVAWESERTQDGKDVMLSSKPTPAGSSRLSSRVLKDRFPNIPLLPLGQVDFGTDCKHNYAEVSTASSQASSVSTHFQSSRSQNIQEPSCPNSHMTSNKVTTMKAKEQCQDSFQSTNESSMPQYRCCSQDVIEAANYQARSNIVAAAPALPPLPPSLPSFPSSPDPRKIFALETVLLSRPARCRSSSPNIKQKKPIVTKSADENHVQQRSEEKLVGLRHVEESHVQQRAEGQELPTEAGRSSQTEQPGAGRTRVENVPSLRLPSLGGVRTRSMTPRSPHRLALTEVLSPKASSGRGNWSNLSIFSDQLTSDSASDHVVLSSDVATKQHAAGQLQRWWRRKAQKRRKTRPATLSMVEACAFVVQRHFRARREQQWFDRARKAAKDLQRWVRLIILPKQRAADKRALQSALKIQQWRRAVVQKRRAIAERNCWKESATQIQRHWRNHRLQNRNPGVDRDQSASCIQRAWYRFRNRRLAQVREVIKLASEPSVCASFKLGRRLHEHLARAAAAELQRRTEAAGVIAYALRGYVARRRFVKSRAAATVLQRYARLALARRKSVILLQRYWRGAVARKILLKEGVLQGSCVKRCSYGPVVHCEVRAFRNGDWILSAAAVCSRSGGLQKHFLDLKPHRKLAGNASPTELARQWLQDLSVTWRSGKPILHLPQRPAAGVLQHLPSRSFSRSLSQTLSGCKENSRPSSASSASSAASASHLIPYSNPEACPKACMAARKIHDLHLIPYSNKNSA